ncbi:DUF3144 domain-containing protein [Pseudolysobacter antarcticus]|uniref:DUF3144 domain-containing protein n=1 Tax=Pseudolysobacter antarcticus TaxID=2511995 RepID=A0A411HMK7_9GAMM|nr:DUF3144 domain-containing protein [Pseudolysobacter antarcticus]QBB71711.1 DUF3144 domain-containing protein [Pseudolysobacter antarcticus]
MSESTDPHFYERADAVIYLANEQNKDIGRGKVSASLMYATARFNAFVSARSFNTVDEMKGAKDETIEYFMAQYRAMLIENLDDYIEHFDKYTLHTES